jgi:type III pantothenate kinase
MTKAEVPMELVVDVGNTEGVVGLFRADALEPEAVFRYATRAPRTADELNLLLRTFLDRVERDRGAAPFHLSRCVIGSVVPAETARLRDALGELMGSAGPVFVVDAQGSLPIQLDVEEPRTVGPDRIVNTLAAAHLFKRDALVVDLGTATTYDCITGDGVFLGGVIAPGIQSGQEWLAGRTAKLPRVDFGPPQRVIGRRTDQCLASGLFYSAVDAMDGIVRRILAEWGRPEVLVLATGGHATLVGPHSATIERIEPHLTLVGLKLAGDSMAGDAPPKLPYDVPLTPTA